MRSNANTTAIDEAIESCGSRASKRLRKEAALALSSEEAVVAASRGNLGPREGLVILTDRRVYRVSVILGQSDVLSIPFDKIEETRLEKQGVVPRLELQRARKRTKLVAPDWFLHEVQARL